MAGAKPLPVAPTRGQIMVSDGYFQNVVHAYPNGQVLQDQSFWNDLQSPSVSIDTHPGPSERVSATRDYRIHIETASSAARGHHSPRRAGTAWWVLIAEAALSRSLTSSGSSGTGGGGPYNPVAPECLISPWRGLAPSRPGLMQCAIVDNGSGWKQCSPAARAHVP